MSKKEKLMNVGLGAGLLGGLLLAFQYAIRGPTKLPVPDTISPAIFATKVLHTSHGPMVYHESGTGRPLIFVHGVSLGASSYEWSKVYPDFAASFQVLAPDLIGFGESARPPAQLNIANYARMLAEFIRATISEETPILIGSGLGAGICVLLADQHPELVSRLILFMPTGSNDFGPQQMALRTKLISRIPLVNRFLYRNQHSTRIGVHAWLAQHGFDDPLKITEETVNVFTTCAQQYGAEHAVLNYYRGRLNFNLENRIKMLTQPVTFLWSDQPGFPPLEWAYRLQKMIPHSNLVVLENVGQFAALEDPAQMSAVLHEQLQGDLRIFKAV